MELFDDDYFIKEFLRVKHEQAMSFRGGQDLSPGNRAIEMIIDAYNEQRKKEMGDDLSELNDSVDEAIDDALGLRNRPIKWDPPEPQIDPPRDEIGGYRDVPRTVEITPPPMPMTLWDRIKGLF